MTENRVKLIVGEESLNKLYFELTAYTCSRVFVVSDTDKNARLIKSILLKTVKKTDLDLIFTSYGDIESVSECAEEMARDIRNKGCNAIFVAGGKGVIDSAKIAIALLSLGIDSVSDITGELKKGTSYPLFVANVGVGYETTEASGGCVGGALNEVRMKIVPDVLFVDKRLCYIESAYKCLIRRNYMLARVLTILNAADEITEPFILAVLNILKKIDGAKHVMPQGLIDNAYYLSQASAIMCFVKEASDNFFDIISGAISKCGLDLAETYPYFALKIVEFSGNGEKYARLSALFAAGDSGADDKTTAIGYFKRCLKEAERVGSKRKPIDINRGDIKRAIADCGDSDTAREIIGIIENRGAENNY